MKSNILDIFNLMIGNQIIMSLLLEFNSISRRSSEKYRKFLFCCGSWERIIIAIFPFNQALLHESMSCLPLRLINNFIKLHTTKAHTFNPVDSLRYEILQWTPAIQAGLTTKRLTFRHVFLEAIVSSIFVSILCLKRRQNLKFYLLTTCVNNS